MLDERMLALQVYVEKCNKIHNQFMRDFSPLCSTAITFDNQIGTNLGPYELKPPVIKAELYHRWNPPNVKVIYLPFEYAGLKIKLDISKT